MLDRLYSIKMTRECIKTVYHMKNGVYCALNRYTVHEYASVFLTISFRKLRSGLFCQLFPTSWKAASSSHSKNIQYWPLVLVYNPLWALSAFSKWPDHPSLSCCSTKLSKDGLVLPEVSVCVSNASTIWQNSHFMSSWPSASPVYVWILGRKAERNRTQPQVRNPIQQPL